MKSNKLWIAVAVVGVVLLYGFSTYRGAQKHFNLIKASFESVQQQHSNIFMKMEQAGINAKKYGEEYISSITARYGEGGSDAAFQWIQEQNLPPNLREKMHQLVDVEFSKYASLQDSHRDKIRVWEDMLTVPPSSLLLSPFFSIDDVDQYRTILKSDRSMKDYESGKLTAPNIQ